MAHEELCCGLFRGKIYLQDVSDEDAALLPIGNAEITINQELTEIEQPNFQSLGGQACSVSYPESVGADIIMHCTNPDNLAIAFMGQSAKLTGAAVTDEVHTVNAVEELIPFNFVPDPAVAITVKDAATGLITYVKDTDYAVTGAGIVILEGTTIVMGADIEVSYTYGANWVMNAQTVGQKTFKLVLDGLNYGGEGAKPVVLTAWKVKFAPTDSFALISGTDFASLSLSGEILRDDSKSIGSKFFKIEMSIKTVSTT